MGNTLQPCERCGKNATAIIGGIHTYDRDTGYHYVCDACSPRQHELLSIRNGEWSYEKLLQASKESGMKGNQFGLKPGDRVALSEDTAGRVSDSAWYSSSNNKLVNGTIIGYDQYGYPVVHFDVRHKHTGFAIAEMHKNQNQPDIATLDKIQAVQRGLSGGAVDALAEPGRCMSIYAAAAFKPLDANGVPVRSQSTSIKYELVAGDKVFVSSQNGRINDQGWAGEVHAATVVGCNEAGDPILMLDEGCNPKLGWPLSNILNDDGSPRIECTVSKSLRQGKSAAKLAARKCFYVYTAAAVSRTANKEAMKTPQEVLGADLKKNFGLDYGDRFNLSYDENGINFDFTESDKTITATVIGFRKDDGTPVVVFDTENEKSGWALQGILTNTDGVIKPGKNFSLDANLLGKMQDKVDGDFTFYIGNAETFKKINKKSKGKQTNMASKTDMDTEARDEVGTKNKIMTRLKKSAAKTPYRLARMQALTNGKGAILNAVKDRLEPNSFAMLEGLLNSDAGAGAILALIGLIGPMIPKAGEDSRVQGLCEEFLDEGMAKGANEVFNLATSILAPALMSAVAALPPVAEAVEERAAKKEKKRVAAVADPVRSEESEDEDEDEEEAEESSSGKRMTAK